MSHRGIEIDDRETMVVGGSITALVLSVVYWASRLGFESHTSEILRSLGLSLFLLSLPYWLWRAFRRADSDFVWQRSHPFLGVATVALTVVVALVMGPFATPAGLVLASLGAVGAALVLFSWLRNGAYRSRIGFTLGTLVMAAWAAGVVWTSRYKMPLYWETLATNVNVHHDPLYVVTMGNMIRTYGVPSTGLDGVPYTLYHYGTPWLFSRWSDLIGTDLLSFYSLGYAIILIPLFFAALAILATEARKASLLSRPHGWLRSNWWGWLALFIGTIGIIPDSALYAMAVWNAHVFISESYLGGLPIFLMAVSIGVVAWRSEKKSLVLLFVFLPLMIAALAFLKVSLMVLLFALVVYVLFRTRQLFTLTGALSAAVMFVAGYLAYNAVSLPAHNGGISPLHFVRHQTAPGWHQFFPLVHFMWTWVYIAGRLYEERITDLDGVWAAIKNRSIIDVELLLGATILGFLPGALIVIHGGSAIYFSDVPRWLALALVIARAGHWANLWRERRGAFAPTGSLRLATVLGVFIALPFVITLMLNAVKPMARLVRQNVALRSTILANADSSVTPGLLSESALKSGVEQGRYYGLVSELREIQRIPTAEKADMLLFIPQSYKLHWSMWDGDDRCSYVGLFAPAISELAHIDGMPPTSCNVTDQYNMPAYSKRLAEQGDLSDEALCEKVKAKGFRRVMILAPDAEEIPRRRVVECVS
jgi:hypothetical protein